MTYTSHPPAGFTIPKASTDPTTATVPVAKLDLHERSEIAKAAHAARRLFPGPIGETLYRELDVYAQFGNRTDQSGLLPRLVAAILERSELAS